MPGCSRKRKEGKSKFERSWETGKGLRGGQERHKRNESCLNRGQEKGNSKEQSINTEIKWDRYKFKEIMKT